LKKLIASVFLVAGLVVGAPAASYAVPAQLPDFTQLVEQEGKAVVNINTTQTVHDVVPDVPEGLENDPFYEFFRRFAPPRPREYQAQSLGSGFILSPDGYVLTNAHVVGRADDIRVTLTDRREFKAKLIGADKSTDIALLKIDATNLPVVRLGSSARLKVGEWVVAIGSPFGFENSVTAGVVSAKGRQLPDSEYVPFIQTDVAINPGNSGGPLFNLNGEVVGINSQIYSRSGGFMGISFSIPIDEALKVADSLKVKGKVVRSRIGVAIQDMSRELAASFGLASPDGALIANVDPEGPAGKAGLRSGDVVLKVNGSPVSSPSDLARMISAAPPGSRVDLQVWRDRKPQSLQVTVEEMRDKDMKAASQQQDKPASAGNDRQLGQVGLLLRELSAAQLSQLGVRYGLLVERSSGTARTSGILPGDVIIGVAGEPLSSLKQFAAILGKTPKGGVVPVRLLRQGNNLFVALKVGEGSQG
jgi:serine protease Do